MLTRRTFIAGGTSTCLLTALPAVARPAPRVIVVGAGLAGLCAGFELKRAGYEVTILERSGHPGGRVRTVRDHFADGAWVDVGAQGVGSGYETFLGYCRSFGLALIPRAAEPSLRPGTRPDSLVVLGGRSYRQARLLRNPELWPLELGEQERSTPPGRLLSHYLMPVARQIGRPENVLDGAWSQYDTMTLREYLQRRGASPDALELMDRSLNYNSLDGVSALSALRDATRLLERQTSLHIDGGNDRLPRAFAAELRQELRYGTELIALEQRDDGVLLRLRIHGEPAMMNADRVILALPFPALARIDIAPALSPERRRMIDELPYTQVAKTHVQTRSRFWDRPDDISMIYTDTAYERIFDLSEKMPGPRGLLLNWINGDGLAPFMEMSEAEHAEAVVDWMRGLWPDRIEEFETALTTNWGRSYAGGAYAHYAPGQLQRWAPRIPEPIGRLHFAGEHTELVAPGVEGALVSGLRAAREVADLTA